MTATPRLAITELASAQAVPETTVNEALIILEFFANGCHFKSRATTDEPGSPAEGDCYLLPASPTGTHWSGKGGKIALFYNAAWVFKTAKEGFLAWVDDEDQVVAFDGTNWNAFSAAAEASDAQMWAGSDTATRVSPRRLATASAPQTLTDGATINWNMANGINAKVTLTASGHNFAAPTNPHEGMTYRLEIIQDGTGSRTATFDSAFDFGSAGTPTLSTGANKHDFVYLDCYDASTPKFRATFNKAS